MIIKNPRLGKSIFFIVATVLVLAGWFGLGYGYEVNKNAIILLIVKDAKGNPFATGTGFIAKPEGIVVTNYHVLVDAFSVEAISLKGNTIPVEGILKVDRTKDFAILKLKDDFYSTLEMGDSDTLRELEYTSALGYLAEGVMRQKEDLRGSILQTYGFALGIHSQAFPEFSYIYTTAPFGPGFSGGPLVDKDNKVVGLATVEGRAINLALPINYVKPFLNETSLISLKQLREEDENSKEALYFRGNYALYALGDTDLAIRNFEEAVKKDPNFTLAYNDLAIAYRDKGLKERAIETYEKVIKLNPNFPEALSNLGGYYFRQGNTEKAVSLFQQAIKVYPNFLQALSNLAAVLNKLNRFNESIPLLQKTLRLDPEFGIAYFNLGNAQFALNQLDEAQNSFGRSVTLGIDFLSLHWKLYEIHQQKGRKKQAADELRIILQIDPLNSEAGQKLKELSSSSLH